MRTLYSYLRLTFAAWMFLGGLALQFASPAALERDNRQRERLLQTIPQAERAEWIKQRDLDDGRSEAALRVFGVLLGGVGFAMALFEAAYVSARASRHCPLDAP